MKKVVWVVAALLALAYPAATWWTGKQVEAQLAEQYTLLEQTPFVKVVKRDFQRGFMSSTDVATYEVFGDMFRSLQKAQGERDASGSDQHAAPTPLEPLRFTMRNVIQHGPFAAGQVAAAVVDTDLVFDAANDKTLTALFGDKKPLTARTVLAFDGGGRTTLESPSLTHVIEAQPQSSQGKVTLVWGGMKANMVFTRNVESFTLNATAPSFDMKDEGEGGHAQMAGFTLVAEQKRVFADEPLLYSGTQTLTIAQVDMRAVPPKAAVEAVDDTPAAPAVPVTMKKLSYFTNMVAKGDFLDMVGRMSAESFTIDKQDYGPAHYDVSAKHLHARTVAKLYRALMQMYADPTALAQGSSALLAPMLNEGMTLLSHSPEFAVDRLAFKSPHGEARVSASVRLKDPTPEDLKQPLRLLGKLDASADLKVPEALLAEFGASKATDADEKQMLQQQFTAQAEALAAEGFVTRNNGLLESKLVFQNGQLTINGKPFDPSVLAGGGGVQPNEVEAPPAPRRKGRGR